MVKFKSLCGQSRYMLRKQLKQMTLTDVRCEVLLYIVQFTVAMSRGTSVHRFMPLYEQ